MDQVAVDKVLVGHPLAGARQDDVGPRIGLEPVLAVVRLRLIKGQLHGLVAVLPRV